MKTIFKYLIIIGAALYIFNGCGGSSSPKNTETAVETGWILLNSDAKEGESAKVTLGTQTDRDISVSFSVPTVHVYEKKFDGLLYHHVDIPQKGHLLNKGKPELPIVGTTLEVPAGVELSVEVVKADYKEYDGYQIYPSQGALLETEEIEKLTVDEALYATDAFYPSAVSTIKEKDIAIARGHRLLFLKVNPVLYNPVSKKLRVYYNLDVKVKYNKAATIEEVDDRLRSNTFESVINSSILNSNLELNYEPRYPFLTGADYLIITTSDFYNPQSLNDPLTRFKTAKEEQGFSTQIRLFDDASAEDIMNFMETVYTTWNPVPSYLLIVGDSEFIATNYNSSNAATDIPYVQLDGNDSIPDILIGRLSVDTKEELEVVQDKIITYENIPPISSSFYNNITLAGLFQDVNEDGYADRGYVENLETVRSILMPPYSIHRIYTAGIDSSLSYNGIPEYYRDGIPIPGDLQTSNGFSWDGTSEDIIDDINEGRLLVTYRNHGGVTDFSAFNFGEDDINSLTNGNLTPVVFSIACQNGYFDSTITESLAETFIRKENGGAVAVIAATRNTGTWQNNLYNLALTRAAFIDKLATIGEIELFAKKFVFAEYGVEANRDIERYHIFGDPSMRLYTSNPNLVQIKPPEILYEIPKLIIRVTNREPLHKAQVSIFSGETFVATALTDSNGEATFDSKEFSEGTYNVVVTAPNHLPVRNEFSIIK